MEKNQKPELQLMPKSWQDMVQFIDEYTGEKLTPEEIEQLRQLLPNEGSSQSHNLKWDELDAGVEKRG